MRHTYDNKNPFGKTSSNPSIQTKDLESHSVQSKMSYQKHPPNQNVSNNEKMNKNITQILKKLNKYDETKSLALTSLKPNQKTLLSVIAFLLNSFDNVFQEAYLSIELIPDLFRVLGYPNTINKTYFQPVGAPHTWGQCLSMMDWLAQLASFHKQIIMHLEEGGFQPDFTSMLITAYLEQNPQIIKSQLTSQINKKAEMIENYQYTVNTLNLQIQNLKAAQKDLTVMQEEQRKLESVLNREKQEVIQVNQQNWQMQRKIRDLEAKIQQQKRMTQINDNEIISLMKQIQNQQLSVEQVDRIRFQIKEYHQKITQLKKILETQKQNLDKIDTNIVNEYIDFSKTLECLRHMHKKHKYEIQKRNIYFQIPECNIVDFTNFLKQRSNDCSEVRIQNLLGTKQIKQVKDKADILLTLVASELTGLQDLKQKITNQNKQLNGDCLNWQLKNNELDTHFTSSRNKLQGVKGQIQQATTKNKQTSSQITLLQDELGDLKKQQQKVISEAQSLSRTSKQLLEIKFKFESEANSILQRISQRLDAYKVQTLQLVEDEFINMEESNGMVDQYISFQFPQADQQFFKYYQNGAYLNHNAQNGQNNMNQQQGNSENVIQNNQYANNYQGQKEIEIPRYENKQSNDEYWSEQDLNLFKRGSFESPKNDRVNRLKRFGFQN